MSYFLLTLARSCLKIFVILITKLRFHLIFLNFISNLGIHIFCFSYYHLVEESNLNHQRDFAKSKKIMRKIKNAITLTN